MKRPFYIFFIAIILSQAIAIIGADQETQKHPPTKEWRAYDKIGLQRCEFRSDGQKIVLRYYDTKCKRFFFSYNNGATWTMKWRIGYLNFSDDSITSWINLAKNKRLQTKQKC